MGELHFDVGQNESHFGRSFWVSVGMHAMAIAAILLIATLIPKRVIQAVLPETLPDLVFLQVLEVSFSCTFYRLRINLIAPFLKISFGACTNAILVLELIKS